MLKATHWTDLAWSPSPQLVNLHQRGGHPIQSRLNIWLKAFVMVCHINSELQVMVDTNSLSQVAPFWLCCRAIGWAVVKTVVTLGGGFLMLIRDDPDQWERGAGSSSQWQGGLGLGRCGHSLWGNKLDSRVREEWDREGILCSFIHCQAKKPALTPN